MGVAGSISPPGGAPKPDPERVATLRYTLVDEPETCAAFGEAPRATLVSLNERALAETRSGDLGECSLLLDHVRDRVAGLSPARLEPRGGLAGLFDSRNKRLKAFRAAYVSAASAVTQSAADIADRAGALARKDTALETLWTETRDAIADLNAHIAAARNWLANEAPGPAVEPSVGPVAARVEDVAPELVEEGLDRCEAQADAEAHDHTPVEAVADPGPVNTVAEATPAPRIDDAPPDAADAPVAHTGTDVAAPSDEIVPEDVAAGAEPESASEPSPKPALEPTPVASLPHPLETRLAALEAVRATAIGRLALLRAAQNADCRTPAALKQVCDAVEAWRADWQDALGLAGKRPRKVTPDRVRLSNAASTLSERIDAAGREISAAQGRRAELDARTAPAPPPKALAA